VSNPLAFVEKLKRLWQASNIAPSVSFAALRLPSVEQSPGRPPRKDTGANCLFPLKCPIEAAHQSQFTEGAYDM